MNIITKPLTLLLTAALLVASCASAGKQTGTHAAQQSLFPPPFKQLYFGMSLESFQKVRPVKTTDESKIMSFRLSLYEQKPAADIVEAIYYFSAEKGAPQFLYELIIQYATSVKARDKAISLYGQPNHGDKWKIDSKEAFDIYIWTYENKIILAAKMKGTEWENESL